MRDARDAVVKPDTRGVVGGRFAPLQSEALTEIDKAARHILTNIGMSDASDDVTETIVAKGGAKARNGRLLFSEQLIADALRAFDRDFTLHGRAPGQEIRFQGRRVHTGTGGASPMIIDHESGSYRDATLADLHNAARLVNQLDNIHLFSRPLVARDLNTDVLLDINTAFACLSGTTKPIFTSATFPESVVAIADMCFEIAGSRNAFSERPFLALNINHVVPPLRFSAEACAVLKQAALLEIPFNVNTFGQVGASEPVTLAGSLAQTTAETLAGMIYGWCINPKARMTFGARPMVTDLRTGAMAGGGGEQALIMAAAIQMAKYYELPDTCIAGATDSKIADTQSGYEKSLSITLAAQAGSNVITQAAGTQASLMAAALESFVIDDDMLGAILRSLAPLVVDDETINLEAIEIVANGDGHFFGRKETLDRMKSDFLYPELADRNSHEQWESEGSLGMRERAKARVTALLENAPHSVLPKQVEESLRSRFDIRLPEN